MSLSTLVRHWQPDTYYLSDNDDIKTSNISPTGHQDAAKKGAWICAFVIFTCRPETWIAYIFRMVHSLKLSRISSPTQVKVSQNLISVICSLWGYLSCCCRSISQPDANCNKSWSGGTPSQPSAVSVEASCKFRKRSSFTSMGTPKVSGPFSNNTSTNWTLWSRI